MMLKQQKIKRCYRAIKLDVSHEALPKKSTEIAQGTVTTYKMHFGHLQEKTND